MTPDTEHMNDWVYTHGNPRDTLPVSLIHEYIMSVNVNIHCIPVAVSFTASYIHTQSLPATTISLYYRNKLGSPAVMAVVV